ncbi:putative phosphoenolpyruvate synthase [Caerostris extrusa]|uniref:Phosphoenolpyruvate synthase n=1 Tax=Caerostris extrusa TaxID=172846 RepID=A0AAV4SCA4_CAEEX|nr:putative phosphoenolpyruvate synthase [Caerostris extrusa]
MRRWRIFYCGMLRETSTDNEVEETVFVKFVFIWKASSDVYDCNVDNNPREIATAMAKADWKYGFSPPVKKFLDAFNFYAQTGVATGDCFS